MRAQPEWVQDLEKFVELRPGLETKQSPQLGLGQASTLIFFKRQRFERAA